jgi:hypothetical protein
MKGARSILYSLTVGFAVLAPPWTYLGSRHFGEADAATVVGTVTFVGTLKSGTSVNSLARVRITTGECDGSPIPEKSPLYIIIDSGNLNSSLSGESNRLYMKNAYSTLLTALLSGKSVQIDGLVDCSPNTRGEVSLDLPNGNVSIIQ